MRMKEKKRSLKYYPSALRGLPEPTITAALMQWFLCGPGIAFSIPHYTENKYAKQEHFFHPCAFLFFFMRTWTRVLARTVRAQKELGKLGLPESPPICRHFSLMSGAKFLTRSVKVWAGGNVGKECYRWHCKVSFSTLDADARVWVLASPLHSL